MNATIRNDSGETVGTVIHLFERAGLGRAPFRFVGFEVKTFQACQGAPIQPGASCDYCGTGISNVFWIESADRKRFKVGCDCVAKTEDGGLRRVIDAKVAQHKRDLAHKRADAKITAALEALPLVSDKLAALPHPRGFEGLSALDYVQWMLKNAGRKGKVEAAKLIATVTQ